MLHQAYKKERTRRFNVDNVFEVPILSPTKFHARNGIELFRTTQYGGELPALAAFMFLLRPDDVVWDVGASVGLFSVHAAMVARCVVAFEPDPEICARCQQNVTLNAQVGKVYVENVALGEEVGEIKLYTDGLEGMSPSIMNLSRHSSSTRVPVTTIDEAIKRGMTRPTVVKLDIEGAEAAALRGAPKLLGSRNAPRLLFIEGHPEFLPRFGSSLNELEDLVRGFGYRIEGTETRDEQVHLLAFRG